MQDRPIVIGLGELLWDCFDDSRRPGGAPANVAFQANQLGCTGIVCSRIGQDDLGQELQEFLERQGLSTRHLQFDPQQPTGTVTVDTSEAGNPQYVIHEGVAWDAMEFSPDWHSLMQSASAVCFGTLAQRETASRETIHACLAATPKDCLRVYDVNLRQNYYSAEILRRSLAAADVLKLNHHEIATVSELLELPAGIEDFAAHVAEQFGLSLVCVTQAERGCRLFAGEETVDVPGEQVEVVDAVGAGDAFTAGLIYALLQEWPLEAAGRFANQVGARVAASEGAMPELRNEFAELIQAVGVDGERK